MTRRKDRYQPRAASASQPKTLKTRRAIFVCRSCLAFPLPKPSAMKACRCIGRQVVTQLDSFPLIETRGADGPRCRPMDGKQKKAPVG